MAVSKERRREISLKYLHANREKHKAYNDGRVRMLKERNYAKYMLDCVKANARKTGREVTITVDDIIIPDVCPVLGITLDRFCARGARDAAPSIDRIDNSKGYIPGNIIVVSMRANQIKGTATVDELEKVLTFYRELEDK